MTPRPGQLDGDGENHPDSVSWITTSSWSGSNGSLPKGLLTKDDLERQADAVKNARDKALWMLYETGACIGELIDLTVGVIKDHQQGKGGLRG